MRQCSRRVPHTKRRWRLETHLREDGLLPESESEEETGVIPEAEESEEDLSGLEVTDSETEEYEEEPVSLGSDSQEDNNDWYGLIET